MSSGLEQAQRYATIAEAIRFVNGQAVNQPTLQQVADHVGLSPHYLQRLFSAWVGISPKRFLQYLTKERAKDLLQASHDLLSVSLDSGLSGPGRLHDLLVSSEAMTPGEAALQGEGLVIRYGSAPSPLGVIFAGITDRGVCHLRFIGGDEVGAAFDILLSDWPRAQFERNDTAVAHLERQLFGQLASGRPLMLLLRGTNYQIKVWEALMKVPPGVLLSYSDFARQAGMPGAQRSVGSAMAANDIALLIPCHRVIRQSGEVGQYRWGSERKQALLIWEQERASG